MTALEPAIDTGHSPYHDLIGFRLVEWRADFARAQLELTPDHHNRSGIVHGGVVLSMLDQASGFCGLYCTVPGNTRLAVTVSLTTNFTGQASEGVLTAIGEKVGGGRSIFFTRARLLGPDGAVLGLSQGVHRYRSGSESPEGVPQKR
ncbi:MAG: PaaI family thioesterase [Acetobacterales bacterium]